MTCNSSYIKDSLDFVNKIKGLVLETSENIIKTLTLMMKSLKNDLVFVQNILILHLTMNILSD